MKTEWITDGSRPEDGKMVVVMFRCGDSDVCKNWTNAHWPASDIADIKAYTYLTPPEKKLICPRCGGGLEVVKLMQGDWYVAHEGEITSRCFCGPVMPTKEEAIDEYMKWVRK